MYERYSQAGGRIPCMGGIAIPSAIFYNRSSCMRTAACNMRAVSGCSRYLTVSPNNRQCPVVLGI